MSRGRLQHFEVGSACCTSLQVLCGTDLWPGEHTAGTRPHAGGTASFIPMLCSAGPHGLPEHEVLVKVPPACSAVQPGPSQPLPVTMSFCHLGA